MTFDDALLNAAVTAGLGLADPASKAMADNIRLESGVSDARRTKFETLSELKENSDWQDLYKLHINYVN